MQVKTDKTNNVLSKFQIFWISISCLYLIFLVTIKRSFFWSGKFYYIDVLSFISIEILCIVIVGLFFSFILLADIIGTFLLFLFINYYILSWAVFWASGVFIDSEWFRMVGNDTLQLFMHLTESNPGYLLLLFCISSIFTVVFRIVMKRKNNCRIVKMKFVIMFLILVTFTGLYRPLISEAGHYKIRDDKTGISYDYSNLVEYTRKYKTGPLSRIFFDIFARENRKKATSNLTGRINVRFKPYIPMKAYIASNPVKKKWNVLIILIESLRQDVLKSSEFNPGIMPALDKLVSKSVIYTNMYTQSSHSDYADLCPLSSHYPLRSKEHHYYPENPTYSRTMIYDILKHTGYRTAVISSQNEHWGNMYNYLRTGNIDHFYHAESVKGDKNNKYDDLFYDWMKKFSMSGKIDDSQTVDEAIGWIGKSKKPFFIYMNLQNSHFPYRVPPGFKEKFKPCEIDFPFAFGRYPLDKKNVVKNR